MDEESNRKQKTRVTIRDIAEYCNLSIGAVSGVLQNRYKERRFADSTVWKIRDAVRILGYIPDLSARRLRKLSTEKFPLVLAILSSYEAAPATVMAYLYTLRHLVDTIPQIKEKFDVSIVLEMFSAGKLSEKKSLLSGDSFNAAIIANTTEEDDEFLKGVYLPYPNVVAGRHINSYYGVIDAGGHGRKVVSILVKSGRRRLGILMGSPLTVLTATRRDDFLRAADGAVQICAAGLSEADGYLAVKKFIKGGGCIDGLFVVTDVLAAGAYKALKEAGLSIPKDVSVIGVGDYSYSEFLDPPLTTVGTLRNENAKKACSMLIAQILRDIPPPYVAEVPLKTTLRGSH